VNGAASLLVLAAIAIAAPSDLVTLARPHFQARLEVAMRADQPTPEPLDGVPISLLIQNDSDVQDRLLSASTPVAKCGRVRRAFLVTGRQETAPVPEGIVISAQASITL
jgi:copper(I)-binding protein